MGTIADAGVAVVDVVNLADSKMDRLESAVDGSDRDAIQSALNVAAKLLPPLDRPELKVARYKLQEIDANSARCRAFLEVWNPMQV
jgi:hypothetical protein